MVLKWRRGRHFAHEPTARGQRFATIVEWVPDQSQGSYSGALDSGSPDVPRDWAALIPTWDLAIAGGRKDRMIEPQRLSRTKKRNV
jgi:hypothetical protein